MTKIRQATFTDYFKRQGGVPEITQRHDGLWQITHRYRDDCPQVTTHISPKERGTVIIGNVEFEVSKLWQFEGGGCESKSKEVKGEGYERLRNK